MKQPGKIVIWPHNLDSSKTRSEGRKISKSQSVPEPKLNEIETAAKIMSLQPSVTNERARPSSSWLRSGYVVVERKDGRIATLQSIVRQIARQRQLKTQPEKPK
ncbi:MAG: signal recognition particle subunit SRP19/SEC65 family protein [archaeon]